MTMNIPIIFAHYGNTPSFILETIKYISMEMHTSIANLEKILGSIGEIKLINIAQIGICYRVQELLRNFIVNKNCSAKIVVDLSQERREFVKSLYLAVHYLKQLIDPRTARYISTANA